MSEQQALAVPARRHGIRVAAAVVGASPRATRIATAAGWGAFALLCLFLVVAHIVVVGHGHGWTSPLLLADHVFDLGLALLIVCFGLALGRKIGAPLLGLGDEPLAETLAATAIGIGALSLGTLALGLAHLYYGPFVALIALALTLWLRAELAAILAGAAGGIGRWCRTGLPTAPTLGMRLLVFVLAATFLALLLDATVWPGWGSPMEWDAPAYHLSAPRLYLAAHRFLPLPGIQLANAPSGNEMLLTLGLLAGSEGMGKMLHLLATIGMAAATFSLARRLCGPPAAWIALFLLFSVLWIWVEVPATMPDFAAVCFLLLGITDLIAWAGHDGAADRRIIRAGMLIGLALSFKLTNLPALPAAVTTVGLCALAHGAAAWPKRALGAARNVALLVLAALVPLGPWLLKNIAYFGNALYPVAVQTTTPRQSTIGGVAAQQAQHAQSHLWWLVGAGIDIFWGSVGPLGVLLLLSPFVLRRRADRAVLLFLACATVLWLLFVPAYKEPRYYVPIIALADVLIAAILAAGLARIPLRPAIAELPLIAYLLVQTLLGLGIAATQVIDNDALAVARGAISRDAYLGARVRPYQAEIWANEHLSHATPIVLIGVTRGYYLDGPYLPEWYDTRLNALAADPYSRAAEIATWCLAGAHDAILDRGDDSLDSGPGVHIQPRAAFTWLAPLRARVLFSAHGVDVLAIHPCTVAAAS